MSVDKHSTLMYSIDLEVRERRPEMETLYRVENAELGIASEIRKTLEGSKRTYALYMIDTDADSVVMTQLGDNYDRFVDKADEFAHVNAWAN